MKRVLLIAAILCLLSACDFNTDPEYNGAISGTITDKETGHTVGNMKVYLINLSQLPDSLHLLEIRNMFVDSTYTNSNGTYRFENLSNGIYTASPNVYKRHKDIIVYLSGSSQTAKLNINGNEKKLDFLVEDNIYENQEKERIEIKIKLLNIESRELKKIVRKQKGWFGDIPWLMFESEEYETSSILGGWILSTNVERGYSAGIFSFENYHIFEIHTLSYYSGGLGESTKSFVVPLPCGDCPPTLYWKYDYHTNTRWSVTEEEFFGG